MDPKLEAIIRGLIRAERSRSASRTARALAQLLEGIPAGHSYRTIAIDQEAAREYEARAKQWLAIITRALSAADFAWTEDRANEVRHLLDNELLLDWEELVALARKKATPRNEPLIRDLDAAKNRITGELANELSLLVLAQDRSRVPLDEQLQAPRYAAVLSGWRKAKELLDGPHPDLPNAAKESIGAVEQLARIVAGKPSATLGDLIREFRNSGLVQAPLLKGLEEIWGWASDTPSVRHGAAPSLVVDETVARYIASQSAAALYLLLAADST